MAQHTWRMILGAASVLTGAFAGVVTNVVTDRPTFSWVVCFVTLVVVAIALNVGVSILERRSSKVGDGSSGGEKSGGVRSHSEPAGQWASQTSGVTLQAGRDVTHGVQGRHHFAVVAIVAIALTLLGALVFLTSRDSNTSGAESVIRKSKTPSEEMLRITPSALSEPPTWHVVFPAGASNTEKFTTRKRYERSTSSDPFHREELDAGGYLIGSVTIRLELENLAETGLTVFDIRVASLKSEPVPLGTAIFVEPAGGDPPDYVPREVYLDLDAVPPVPQQRLYENGRDVFHNFFDVERIGLEPGQKQTLDLFLETDRAAYSFAVELHYEVGGRRYVREMTRNGDPFRVAVNLCEPFDNPGLNGAHYAAVRSNYPFPPDRFGGDIGRLYEIHSLDPMTACTILE